MSPTIEAGKKFAGVGDAAVRRATGRTWTEWFAVLDAAGASKYDHKGIVAVLGKRAPSLSGWWRQMLTVGYEQARGLRSAHEKVGGFAASASKTIGAPIAVAYTAWSDDRLRHRWLGGARYEIRKTTPNKSVRIRWGDDTRVDVNLYASGPAKCQVQVQHEKLADEAAVAKAKEFWKARLERLAALVEGALTPGNPRAASGPARARNGTTRTNSAPARSGSAARRPAAKPAAAKKAAAKKAAAKKAVKTPRGAATKATRR